MTATAAAVALASLPSLAPGAPPFGTPADDPAPGAGVQALGDDLQVRPLADGVWLHTSWLELRKWGRTPANGLVVVSDGEAALVDTPWTDGQTRALARWLDETAHARLVLVVVTHAHGDCLGGLGAAHALGARSLARGATVALARRDGAVVPRESFERERDVGVGGRILQARFLGGGHTPDNIVVWIPDARVLFGGCLVRSASATSLGNVSEADLASWPRTLRALLDAYGDAAVIVPGHGRPGGAELVRHTLDLLAAR
jgi:metallo-beta-lactamase class B